MKIKQIEATLSAVIPIASYENLKPSFSIMAELEEGDDVDKSLSHIKDILKTKVEQVSNEAKTDLIKKQNDKIRFYERNGKQYPSVTSVLGWDIDWRISEDELMQYGARGTIVHKIIELYLKEKKWYDPIDIPELEDEVNILMSGSKKLTWKSCSYIKAMENIIEDIELIDTEQAVYNDELLYAGRLDCLCKYKGKLTVLDFKTGTTTDMRQLAAYSICIPNIEQLVIVPCRPTENKSGVKKPVVCDAIQPEFKKFIYARSKFRLRFGI